MGWSSKAATYFKKQPLTSMRDLTPFLKCLVRKREASLHPYKMFVKYASQSHQAKLINCGTPGIWVGFGDDPWVGTYHVLNLKTRKFNLTIDVSFLVQPFGKWNKVEKPTVAPMVCERTNDEELKTVLGNHANNNYCNVFFNSKSEDEEEQTFLQINMKKKSN